MAMEVVPSRGPGAPAKELTGAVGEWMRADIGWYSGVVKQVLNINKKTVKIEWDEDCLGDMDARVSVHQLLPNNWNPKVAKNGGWGQHFKEYSVQ